jgi:hypothetical protein
MARPDELVRLEFSVAIGGAANVDGTAAQPETGANDPKRRQVGPKFRSAARP